MSDKDGGTLWVKPDGSAKLESGETMQLRTPEPVFSPCCVVFNSLTGQPNYFSEHEPDEELEKIVWKDSAKFVTFHDISKEDNPKIGTVRFCKRCRCLYLEDA